MLSLLSPGLSKSASAVTMLSLMVPKPWFSKISSVVFPSNFFLIAVSAAVAAELSGEAAASEV